MAEVLFPPPLPPYAYNIMSSLILTIIEKRRLFFLSIYPWEDSCGLYVLFHWDVKGQVNRL